jgi:hypothetical protein
LNPVEPATSDHPSGLRRSAELFRLYRREPVDPGPFYDFLASDTMAQLDEHRGETTGIVVDIGGAPATSPTPSTQRGGRPIVVEYSEADHLHGRIPQDAVVGDGQRLPLGRCGRRGAQLQRPGAVPDPMAMLGEMVRVCAWVASATSYTPWLSPWGGHETSPWHFTGEARAAKRYERKTGAPPKNEYGVSLFELRMPPVREWFAAQSEIEVLWEGPRYWPPSWRPISHVPVVGEVVAWNHLILFRRR